MRLHEIYLDHDFLHLVTELLSGGPIDARRAPGGKFSDAVSARIIKQAL